MKKTLLALTFVVSMVTTTFAQTAQNWTKTDCSGNTTTLFTELDKGKVVIMQFDMMSCTYCTNAANHTDPIFTSYQTSNPGKVLMFSLGYNSTTTCAQMKSWKTTNGYSFPVIEKCPNDVAYYGGMGMPTIVIAGCSTHKVYYNQQGFVASDTALIKNAINKAIKDCASTTGIKEESSTLSGLNLFPNPATSATTLSFNSNSVKSITVEVYNSLGQKVLAVFDGPSTVGENKIEIKTSTLPNGSYFIRASDGENMKTIELSILN